MGIKETPTNIKVYYNSMKNAITLKHKEAVEAFDSLRSLMSVNYEEIKSCIDIYKNNFKVNLNDYPEFVEDRYIDGTFLKVAKGMFINRSNNYQLVSDLFDLYNYAKQQKEKHDLMHQIEVYEKILQTSLKEYTNILRIYMTEVHKKMILDGEGYVFGENIGWICINRCLIGKHRPKLDYAATKKKKEELIKAGKRIYNQKEANWCKRNGIEYKAEDYRVFIDKEYCYEIPLLNCKLPNGTKYKLDIADYRHSSVRGKSNEDLIKECNNDTNKICELQVDLKTKLTMCDTTDKILYTKFIRNEAQQPSTTPKACRKNRQ